MSETRSIWSMCDLICDVISYCLWSCDPGKSNVHEYMMKSWLKTTKRENMEIK